MAEMKLTRAELPSRDINSHENLRTIDLEGMYAAFRPNVIGCLERGFYPPQQKGQSDWVEDWTTFDCEDEEAMEIFEEKTKRWLRGCPLPPITSSTHDEMTNRSVTLSFTATENEASKVLLNIPNLICNSMYPFTKVIVYVDTRDARAVGVRGDLANQLNKLMDGGWIHEIRLVESDPTKQQRLLARVFDTSEPINTHVRGTKGFLSYVQGIEECDTNYCVHFDVGSLNFIPFMVFLTFLIFH